MEEAPEALAETIKPPESTLNVSSELPIAGAVFEQLPWLPVPVLPVPVPAACTYAATCASWSTCAAYIES